MQRREFIAFLGGAAVMWPLAADAQRRTARIGFFTPQSPNPSWIEAFRDGMREHGYFEGRNLIITLLAKAFDSATSERSDAVLVLRDDLFDLERQQIGALAMQARLPTMTGWSEYAHAGCLLAYGVNFSDLFRRAASYVDKILNGTAPGDLPITQPEKFELVVNLKVARALGLTIPVPLLVEANEVIE